MKKLIKILNSPTVVRSRFSKANFIIFVLVFAGIGGYILLASQAVSSTANVFVSANGSDSGVNCKRFATAVANPDPTGSTLCASFNKAYQLASCGDVVAVTNGNYGSQTVNATTQNCTNDNLVIITPLSGATPKIAGLNVSNAGYLEFKGLDFSDSTVSISSMAANSKCGDAGTAQYVTLRDLTASTFELLGPVQNINIIGGSYGPAGNGLHSRVAWNGVAGSSDAPCNVIIDGVTVHDVSVCPTDNLGCNTSGTLIHTECLQLNYSSLAAHPSRNITVQNSKFIKCPSESNGVTGGVATGAADGVIIRNNFIGSGMNAGLVVTYDVKNLVIEYNSSPRGISLANTYAACSSSPCGPYTVRGNYMSLNYGTCDNHVSPSAASAGVSFTYRYNAWKSDGGGGTSLCSGNTGDVLVSSLDFRDAANDDYHLNGSTASAVNKGDPLACPATDIDGDSRPQGGICDAGADEYVPPAGSQANIFVAASGSDTGLNCKRFTTRVANPDSGGASLCASLNKAYQLAAPGDIIEFEAGAYPAQTIMPDVANGKPGTSPVTFKANGTVTFNGSVNFGVDGSVTAPSYTTFDGGNTTKIIGQFAINYAAGSKASHNTVQNTHITNMNDSQGALIFTRDVSYFTAKNNDLGPACCSSDGVGIEIRNPGDPNPDHVSLIGNIIHDLYDSCSEVPSYIGSCAGPGFGDAGGCTIGNCDHIDGVQTFGTDILDVEGNQIYLQGDHKQGLFLPGSGNGGTLSDITIANNFVSNTTDTALSVGCNPVGACSGYVKVLFNTVLGSFHLGSGTNNTSFIPGSTFQIVGNIFGFQAGAAQGGGCNLGTYSDGSSIGANLLWDYNLMAYNSPCNNDLAGSATLVQAGWPGGNLTASTGDPDFHLASGSLGIDTIPTSFCTSHPGICVTEDIDAQHRPQLIYDMGADEFGASAVVAKPGDVNGDGKVDLQDLSILLSHYGQTASPSQGDISGDNQVTLIDLSILLSHYGT